MHAANSVFAVVALSDFSGFKVLGREVLLEVKIWIIGLNRNSSVRVFGVHIAIGDISFLLASGAAPAAAIVLHSIDDIGVVARTPKSCLLTRGALAAAT